MKVYEKKTNQGLKLQSISIPGTSVVTLLILVGAGSRYEDKTNMGLSHFLEHMFFKGAEKYKTPMEVSAAVDEFGGAFNAFTGKEYAGYYIKSGRKNLEKSADILSDMLLRSTFSDEEINKERGVILQEMAMYLDMPTYQISWDFERLVFGDQPLGWEQIGVEELIKSAKHQDFVDYQRALYVPENMVISIAGAVEEQDLELLEQFFVFPEDTNQTPQIEPKKFDPTLGTEKYKIRNKKTEQYHINFGVPALPENDPRFPASKVLSVILGGNMSSRCFQNIREEKGLCYSIRTYVDEYTDAGLLTTSAGVKLDDALKAVKAIRNEYEDIAQNGVTPKEFEKAKSYICGKTDLATEDTEDIAHHYAKNELLYGTKESFEDWKTKILAVNREDVNALAKELFVPENYRFAGIGSGLDEKTLQEIIS